VQRIDRILLAVFPPARENADAIAWTVLLAERFGAIVELLGTGDEGADHEAERSLREAGLRFEACVRPSGSTLANSIVNRLERGDCDLVVMGTQHRQSRSHFSISANVRRRSAVPVLAVRAKDLERRFVDDPKEEDAHVGERPASNARSSNLLFDRGGRNGERCGTFCT
jgi:nucleotide-binding universal stress UspA family protein